MRCPHPSPYLLVFFIILLIWPGHLLLAKAGETEGKTSSVNIDLLIRQVEDLSKQSDRMMQDQQEILKTIENLKVWVHRQ